MGTDWWDTPGMVGSEWCTDHQGEIKIETGCSGTDAPVIALKMLVHDSRIRHVSSADVSKLCRTFIIVHAQPEHMYADIDSLLHPEDNECLTHHSTSCSLKAPEIDLGIYGFPCKPFSQFNERNFARLPWAKMPDEKAQPFIKLRDYLQEQQRPKIVIIENVCGLEAQVKQYRTCDGKRRKSSSSCTPLEIIMKGVAVNEKGIETPVGLELIPCYSWKIFRLRADERRLPHTRKRLYIVGIRADVGG
eukprot:5565306-Pyramimonas_sp.AAC.1